MRAAATALVLSARLSNSITSRKAVMDAMLSPISGTAPTYKIRFPGPPS